MGFDDELPGRMRTGVDGLQPDVTRLVAGGMERGKRFVRRRRIVQVVAAAATVAVFGGVAYAAPWNQDAQLQVANTPPKPAVQPAAKPKQVDITPQATLQLLLDQLPAGAKTTGYSGGSEVERDENGKLRPVRTYVNLTYSDSTGAKSHMSFSLNWFEGAANGAAVECPEPFGAGEWYYCDYRKLEDRSVLRLDRNWEYPASPDKSDGKAGPNGRGAKYVTATLARPDGLVFGFAENNSAGVEKSPETRPTPPLTLAQVKAIALSPTWQTKLDAEYVKQAEKLFRPDRPIVRQDPDLALKEKREMARR